MPVGIAHSVARSVSPHQRDDALLRHWANERVGLDLPSHRLGRIWHTLLGFQSGRSDEARTFLALGVVARVGGRTGGQFPLARTLAALLLDCAAIAIFDRKCLAPKSRGTMAHASDRIAGRSHSGRLTSCRRIR